MDIWSYPSSEQSQEIDFNHQETSSSNTSKQSTLFGFKNRYPLFAKPISNDQSMKAEFSRDDSTNIAFKIISQFIQNRNSMKNYLRLVTCILAQLLFITATWSQYDDGSAELIYNNTNININDAGIHYDNSVDDCEETISDVTSNADAISIINEAGTNLPFLPLLSMNLNDSDDLCQDEFSVSAITGQTSAILNNVCVAPQSFQVIDWSETNCMTNPLTTADIDADGDSQTNIFIEKCDGNGESLDANFTVNTTDPTESPIGTLPNFTFNANLNSVNGTEITQGSSTSNRDNKICYSSSVPLPLILENVGIETFDRTVVQFEAFDAAGNRVAMEGTLEDTNNSSASLATSINGNFPSFIPDNIVVVTDTIIVIEGGNGLGALNYMIETMGNVAEFCITWRSRDRDRIVYNLSTCSQDCALAECEFNQCEVPSNISASFEQACPFPLGNVVVAFDNPNVHPDAANFLIELQQGGVTQFSSMTNVVNNVVDGTYDVFISNVTTGCMT